MVLVLLVHFSIPQWRNMRALYLFRRDALSSQRKRSARRMKRGNAGEGSRKIRSERDS